MVRIGIIGCGSRINGVVKRVIEASNGEIEVHGVMDPSDASVASARRAFGDQLVRYDDYRDLCSDSRVDWAFIGSWNACHRDHTVAAFDAGKDVFCEKPLALTIDECNDIRAAWKKSGKRFTIGFTLRYSLHYQEIKRIIDSGEIGDIISMEFNETLEFNHGGYIHSDWRRLRKLAGTHLLEKCCHDVDLVNWLVGSKARRVASFGGLNFFLPKNAGRIDALGMDRRGLKAYQTWPSTTGLNPFTADKDIIDNQIAIIEFENDARATFHTNCNSAIPERRMYINGSRGAIRADVINGSIEVAKIGFNEKVRQCGTEGKGGHGGGDKHLADSVVRSMLQGAESVTNVEDGVKSAVTCFAIDEAADTGRVVDMAPLWKCAGY
jgi:predicted dehydrogenase